MMDKKKLMRQTKATLLGMLKEERIKSNPKAAKKELVALLLKAERDKKARPSEKKRPKKQPKKSAASGRKKGMGTEALRATQHKVEGTKYFTETPPTAEEGISEKAPESEEHGVTPPPAMSLPVYGQDRIVLMVRDSYWIFAYWEIAPDTLLRIRRELGDSDDRFKIALRVYDVTGVAFTGENANGHFDIEVSDAADNWYIDTGRPDRSYCVEIGLLDPDGTYRASARSNPVSTPPAGASEKADEHWMSVEGEFERIYALSGGFEVGEGSVDLRKMMEKQLQQHLASEAAGGAPQKE